VNVTVDLGERSYDVVLANGARHELADLLRSRAPRAHAVAIVTSPALRNQSWFDLESGLTQHVIEVPDGEGAKTLTTLDELCERLAGVQLSRHDALVAVGGGAVTDLTGFAAAVYLRGVALVQVPTSLMGQVDAAIGGKTAVNLAAGKNLVGAFHQPLGVLCDFDTLSTLPERELRSGLGEVAKCCLLNGWHASQVTNATLNDLAIMSVQLKAGIVSHDEKESGQRALLNYGHTLAHAIEVLALERDVDEMRHGEAVAVGLAFAARLAHRLGRIDRGEVENHDALLRAFGLDTRLPAQFATSDVVGAMGQDKKAHHDLTFVLASEHGFDVVSDVDVDVVATVLDEFRGEL
jgi:5-deoxy-5-amino-3-dehydroquinate synthase